jgi:signal transduction histidine kinase/CheY-like chemotaxis protein
MLFSLLAANRAVRESGGRISLSAASSSGRALLEQALKNAGDLARAKSAVIDQDLRRALLGLSIIKDYIELTYHSPKEFRPKPIPNYRAVPPGERRIHWILEKGRIAGPQYHEGDLIRAGLREETYLLGNVERTNRLIMNSMPDIFTIYISTASGQNIQYDGDAAVKAEYLPMALQERPWYKNARDQNALYISGAYQDAAGRGLTVSMAEPFYGAAGEFKGVAGIDIKLEDLDRRVQQTVTGGSGYAVLIDTRAGEAGRESALISAPGLAGQRERAVPAYLGSETNRLLAAMRSTPQGAGASTVDLAGKPVKVYIIWSRISLTGWQLVYAVPESEILAPSLLLRNEIAAASDAAAADIRRFIFNTFAASSALLLGVVAAALLAGRITAGRIARPIAALTRDAQNLGGGCLEYTCGIQTGDEIETLARSFERMAGELRGRTEELEKQTAAAIHASQAKSEFLAVMSHEIRTPLHAVIGLSKIELLGSLPQNSKTNLTHIYQAGSALLEIVNDILDISKIEAGSFELIAEDYDAVSLINDAVSLNRVRIGSKPIAFALRLGADFPRKLRGDGLRIKQVLNNLLSNAIKYTEKGGVALSLEWKRQGQDALLRCSVQDTGPGIREEDRGKLFSKYTQLNGKANRKIEGIGLGLTITKRLVEMMGGKITVESEYGRGSVFTVEFIQGLADGRPIGEETAESLRTFQYTAEGENQDIVRAWMPYGTVLVVDDMPVNLQVARGLLAPYGLRVDTASSGREAVELVRGGQPRYDLIFMDHMMPDMDGLEAVRIIRNEINSEYAWTVPVIALTANALAGIQDMFLANGFNGFISKPIAAAQLDDALNSWVRDRQNRETLSRAEREKNLPDASAEERCPGLLEGRSIAGLDLIRGMEQYGGEAAYLGILRSYLIHTPPILEQLRRPSRERLGDYTVLIHGLKGSSYGICAGALGGKAAELEAAAREGDLEKVQAENAPFIAKAELLLAALEAVLREAEERKAAKPKASAPDEGMLTKLLNEARRYQASAMEETLAEIESYEYERGGELVVWLRDQLDNLEYEAIQKRLEIPAELVSIY